MEKFVYGDKPYSDPIEFVMDRVGNVWKLSILWLLKDQVLRYGELKKSIDRISHKMLTSQLRQLEEDGFILRKLYHEVPPKVEYSITRQGRKAIRVVEVLHEYGLELMDTLDVKQVNPTTSEQ